MNWIKNNWLALATAIIFGIVIFSPNFGTVNFLRSSEFKGVYPLISDDEIYYHARIQDVLRGEFGLGNVYLYEHSQDPFLQPPLSEWIYAGVLKVTSLDVGLSMIVGDFVFPIIGFILLYLILDFYTKNKYKSVFYTSLYFILFLETFGRPISPQLNILFLFAGIFLIQKLFITENISTKAESILSAVLGFLIGITLFISPYHWTALLVLYFLLIAVKAYQNKTFSSIKNTTITFLVYFLPFALIYGYFMIKAQKLAGYADAMTRLGLIKSHLPGTYISVLIGIICLILIWINRKNLGEKYFSFNLALAISIFILNLQNVITGQNLQFSSHYLNYVILALILILTTLNKKRVLTVLVIIFLVIIQRAEITSALSHPFNRSEVLNLQKKAEVFSWLNKNTPRDSVVYSLGGRYDYMLPAYTHNLVYRNFYASFFVVDQDEITERWLIQNLFNPGFNSKYVKDNQREIWGNTYIDAYMYEENRRKILSLLTFSKYSPNERIPETEINEVLSKYNDLKKIPITQALKKYKIDYILLSPEYEYYDEAKSMIGKIPGAKLVNDQGGELIFEIK